nr:MAG TPA_asm: hypothetical protein [Caudoviricetes sp.]
MGAAGGIIPPAALSARTEKHSELQEILQNVKIPFTANGDEYTETTKKERKICSVFLHVPKRFSLISGGSSTII